MRHDNNRLPWMQAHSATTLELGTVVGRVPKATRATERAMAVASCPAVLTNPAFQESVVTTFPPGTAVGLVRQVINQSFFIDFIDMLD